MSERERTTRFERRMSDSEALMWNLEKDPFLRSSFINVTFLDRAPDFDTFRRRIEGAVVALPRLRQRVGAAPARLAPPQWEDDPEFDLDFHVRRIGVAPPGTDRQVLDMAALHLQDPFDRARPLWQYTVVEGLEGGRAALLAKMHHTITDGVGGVRLSAQFLDLERDAPEPPPPASEGRGAPVPDESFLGSFIDALTHQLRRRAGMTQRVAAGVASTLVRPQQLPSIASDAVSMGRSIARQTVVTGTSKSALWTGRRSLHRHFEIARVDLEELKLVAKALGGTVNDAFVTAVAGGAAQYHREKGADVDELRMAMPVNTRDDGSAGGNAFTPSRVVVPAGIKDPVERFRVIHERLSATKSERGLRVTEALAGVINALPTSLVVGFARSQVETVDFATSNLRGAPWDLYIAGAKVLANHPMGPTTGTAFNCTVLSYRGSFDMGLNIDTAAVDSPALLRNCIEAGFEELLALGS